MAAWNFPEKCVATTLYWIHLKVYHTVNRGDKIADIDNIGVRKKKRSSRVGRVSFTYITSCQTLTGPKKCWKRKVILIVWQFHNAFSYLLLFSSSFALKRTFVVFCHLIGYACLSVWWSCLIIPDGDGGGDFFKYTWAPRLSQHNTGTSKSFYKSRQPA